MMNALTPKVIDIIARPFILVPEQSMAFFSSITKGSRVCCRLINVHYFAVSLSFGILIAHFNPRSLSAFAAVVTPFIFIPEERIISGVPTCQGFLHSSSEGLPCDTHTHTRGRKSNSTIEGGRGYLTQKKSGHFTVLSRQPPTIANHLVFTPHHRIVCVTTFLAIAYFFVITCMWIGLKCSRRRRTFVWTLHIFSSAGLCQQSYCSGAGIGPPSARATAVRLSTQVCQKPLPDQILWEATFPPYLQIVYFLFWKFSMFKFLRFSFFSLKLDHMRAKIPNRIFSHIKFFRPISTKPYDKYVKHW